MMFRSETRTHVQSRDRKGAESANEVRLRNYQSGLARLGTSSRSMGSCNTKKSQPPGGLVA